MEQELWKKIAKLLAQQSRSWFMLLLTKSRERNTWNCCGAWLAIQCLFQCHIWTNIHSLIKHTFTTPNSAEVCQICSAPFNMHNDYTNLMQGIFPRLRIGAFPDHASEVWFFPLSQNGCLVHLSYFQMEHMCKFAVSWGIFQGLEGGRNGAIRNIWDSYN